MNSTEILKDWEAQTGFILEFTYYDSIIIENVNNYSARTTDGKVKRKGSFSSLSEGKSLDGPIISEAIEKYIFEGMSVEDTIKNCDDVQKLCFSSKISRDFAAEYKNEKIQNINRYAITYPNKGGYLERVSKDNRRAKITTEKVVLINDLNKQLDKTLINTNFYINKASERLSRLLQKTLSKELYAINYEKVSELYRQGLYPVPKDYKSNIKGFKQNVVLKYEYDFENHPTVAVCTGKKANLIAIDIDKPKLLPAELVELFKNSNSLKSFSVNNKTGEKSDKYKLFFKYSGKLKQDSYINKWGFELLYNKPANIFGAYDYSRVYEYEGELIPMPEEIEKILLTLQSINSPKKTIKTEEEVYLGGSALIKPVNFTEFIEGFLAEKGAAYWKREPNSEYLKEKINENVPAVYETECFFKEEHTTVGTSSIQIFITHNNKIRLNCWHASCRTSLKELEKQLNEEFKGFYLGQNRSKYLNIEKRPEELTLEEVLKCYE